MLELWLALDVTLETELQCKQVIKSINFVSKIKSTQPDACMGTNIVINRG